MWEVVLVEGQETNCSLDTAELAVLGTGGGGCREEFTPEGLACSSSGGETGGWECPD